MKYMIQEYQHDLRVVTEVFDQSYSIEDGIRGYNTKVVDEQVLACKLLRVIVPSGVSKQRGRMLETQHPGLEVVFMEDKEIALLVLLYGGKS